MPLVGRGGPYPGYPGGGPYHWPGGPGGAGGPAGGPGDCQAPGWPWPYGLGVPPWSFQLGWVMPASSSATGAGRQRAHGIALTEKCRNCLAVLSVGGGMLSP